jgi:Rps23 Pro-64 3,4-dihydroxylase Tpa1-like proline 4-hydroxylase
MKKKIEVLGDPFPHIIAKNFYTEEELELIWEELIFLNRPGKLQGPEEFHGAMDDFRQTYKTNHKALTLDHCYPNRSISNILTVTQKIFDSGFLNLLSSEFPQCKRILYTNYSFTKVRYYNDGTYYEPHQDITFDFVAFSYFHKEPKKFSGGELYFPEYGDYKFDCENNSVIVTPSYVKHGVRKVQLENSDSQKGYGRYAITHLFGHQHK